jgi:signal recognition particle subunit SRP54
MTPFERNHPKQINGSRRARIARGSGTSVSEVNQLLERFGEAQKMMRQLKKGGGIPGMPGMPGAGGPGGGRRGKPAPKKKKGKSGNPAKRAQQEQEAARKAQEARTASFENAFGAGAPGMGEGQADPSADDLAGLKLPPGFEKFLDGGKK